MERTVKEWLELLPEPYRTEALENLDPSWQGEICSCMEDAIDRAFCWEETPQGSAYWCDLHNRYEIGEMQPVHPPSNMGRLIQIVKLASVLFLLSMCSPPYHTENAVLVGKYQYYAIIETSQGLVVFESPEVTHYADVGDSVPVLFRGDRFIAAATYEQ